MAARTHAHRAEWIVDDVDTIREDLLAHPVFQEADTARN